MVSGIGSSCAASAQSPKQKAFSSLPVLSSQGTVGMPHLLGKDLVFG